jgi:hypothetical protein
VAAPLEHRPWIFWGLPRFVGMLCALLAWARSRAGWGWLFGANAGLWVLATLDTAFYDKPHDAEESFVTAAPPFVLAGASVAMMARTWLFRRYPVREQKGFWHWAGLTVCLLPLVWFNACWSQGIVAPRTIPDGLYRVYD